MNDNTTSFEEQLNKVTAEIEAVRLRMDVIVKEYLSIGGAVSGQQVTLIDNNYRLNVLWNFLEMERDPAAYEGAGGWRSGKLDIAEPSDPHSLSYRTKSQMRPGAATDDDMGGE